MANVQAKIFWYQFRCNLCKHEGSMFLGPSTLFPSKTCRALILRIIFHDFVTKLSADERAKLLLLRFLSQGRTSLEFATNMLTGSSDWIGILRLQNQQGIIRDLGVFVVFAGKGLMNKKMSAAERPHTRCTIVYTLIQRFCSWP